MTDVDEAAELMFERLKNAQGDDENLRAASETGLFLAEENSDFFASLCMICTSSDEQAPPQIRWLASIVGKNAVSRSWRRTSDKNCVTEEERAYVREALLASFGEPHKIISVQNSAWIANIARIDYPDHWRSLIPSLCEALTTPKPDPPDYTLRVLNCAFEVFEVLVARRLGSHRRSLYVAFPAAFSTIRNIFVAHRAVMLEQHTKGNADGARAAFEIVEVSLKCLRLLAAYGYPHINDARDVHDLLADILHHPALFFRGSDGGEEHERRLSLHATELVATTFKRHPVQFHVFLPRFLEVYYNMMVTYNAANDSVFAEAAKFLSAVLVCPDFDFSKKTVAQFRQSGDTSSSTDVRVQSRHMVLSFFNEARVDALMEVILTKIYVLREDEVVNWLDDPESFVCDAQLSETTDWATTLLRNECDIIFRTLFIRDRERIAPKLVALTESVPLSKPLLLDSCYRAMGNVMADFSGSFDFEPWLHSKLGPVLQAAVGDNVAERILQSRMAWSVGKFTALFSRESRAALYDLLVNLMVQPNGDRVAAFTAANSLMLLLEDSKFHVDDFIPQVAPCVMATFKLMYACDGFDMKRNLVMLTSRLIAVVPRDAILTLLPAFAKALLDLWQLEDSRKPAFSNVKHQHWSDSVDTTKVTCQSMKGEIIDLLVKLMQKSGTIAHVEPLNRFVHEVVLFTTDVGTAFNPKDGFLVELGCNLWTQLVKCSTEYTEDLDKMFKRVPAILEFEIDLMKEVSRLIESYALLGRDLFIRSHGQTLDRMLEDVFDISNPRRSLAAAGVVDLLLRLHGSNIVTLMRSSVGYMRLGLQHQVGVAKLAYANAIARASVLNMDIMKGFIIRDDDEVFEELLKTYVKEQRVGSRRILVLALCSFATQFPTAKTIRKHIPRIFDVAAEVYSLPLSTYQTNNTIVPEDERRFVLHRQELANYARIGDAISSMMNAQRGCADGEAAYHAIMQKVNPESIKKLERLISEENLRSAG